MEPENILKRRMTELMVGEIENCLDKIEKRK